ncbi:MAG TPA: dTDP-4-dehydrorhamnose 3,5-epimerase [Candidatus Saccharimonas sp.]|nr:dTDP-4-dehydrorhamnose 3,5-epimerase [Candidatus Saccharimonas sp.]
MTDLAVRETSIPGLLEIQLAVHGDSRGWFRETFQAAKLAELGYLKDFRAVQANVSFNHEAGVTRGIHAEPWDKHIALAHGRAFVAIVDLRRGPTFGQLETFELTEHNALFVPRGCGNSYQTLAANTAYTYLVNAHWSPVATYTMVNLFDPDLAVPWPIERDRAIISDKDAGHPLLRDVTPMEV